MSMKKLIALILCLMLCGTAAMAEVYVADLYGGEEDPSSAMLIDDNGTPLTPFGAYAMIGTMVPQGTPESERVYCAEPMQIQVPADQIDAENFYSYFRLALMGPDGSLLTGYDYCDLEYACPDRIVFTMPTQMRGVMDFKGNIILEAGYAAIIPDGQGGWLALAMDARCYHGANGRTRLNPLHYGASDACAIAVLFALLGLVIGANVLL